MERTIIDFEASYYEGMFKLDHFSAFMGYSLPEGHKSEFVNTGSTLRCGNGHVTQAVYHIEPRGVTLHYASTYNGDKRRIVIKLFGNREGISDIEKIILAAATKDEKTSPLLDMKDKLVA